MPDKTKISNKTSIAAIIFLFAPAVILWLCWHRWFFVLLWYVFIYLFQWVYDIVKFRRFEPPGSRMGYKYLKGKIEQRRYNRQRITNGLQAKTPNTPNTPFLTPNTPIKIKSLSNWLVLDYFQCAYYGNYESIGTGPEVIDTYNDLISQFAQMRADESTKKYIELKKTISILIHKCINVIMNIEVMDKLYVENAAERLRFYFPQKQFTRNTYKKDIEYAKVSLIETEDKQYRMINNDCIRYDQTMQKLAKWESEHATVETKPDPLQSERENYKLLAEINKIEGTRYTFHGMFMMEYAVLLSNRQQWIKDKNEEIRQLKKGR